MYKRNRKGSIELLCFTLLICTWIILVSVYVMLNIQINAQIYPIKQDLFFFVQNAYFAFHQQSLEYENYSVEQAVLQQKIIHLISEKYTEVEVTKLYWDASQKQVKIQLIVKIRPVILSQMIGEIPVIVTEEIKLKMMEVNTNEKSTY